VSATGLARSTVWEQVNRLIDSSLVHEIGGGTSSGGRPPTMLAFNANAGVLLSADLGATHCRIAVTDLSLQLLGERAADIDIADGPAVVLGWVETQFDELLAEVDRRPSHVRGIGIGVPGPVEFAAGRAVAPPIMPGWHDVRIPEFFRTRFDCPVLVDNDVNIMALGEYGAHAQDAENLLFVKVGTGIGCGIISHGRIHRGAQGAAGDIGHVRVGGYEDVVCRCGNTGCIEAVAGGAALARQLTARGLDARDARDVVALVRRGSPEAAQVVREAGRLLGQVLAVAVNLFNPSVIVLGGDVALAGEQFFAGVREVVYQYSTPLATRDLRIVDAQFGDRAGVVGAAAMVAEYVLAPEQVDRLVATA
jgi:glucokinase-like ROK family protein